MWQWDRAHQQATAVEPEPMAPIAEVMVPGAAGRGEGRIVQVEGEWADEPAAIVTGKAVDGTAAVLLVRPFTVDAAATGTGAPATLGVLSGWLPADDQGVADAGALPSGQALLTGYVRAGEGASPLPDGQASADAVRIASMSTATLAQMWPSPTYSYLLVSDEPADGWLALPAPEAQSRLDVRSLLYAAEWWVFGCFGAFVAARFVRDNGRIRRIEESP